MKKILPFLLVTVFLFNGFPSVAQWLSTKTTSVYHHYAVNAVSEDIIYAGGYGGSFLKSVDGGATWKSVGIGSTDWIMDIHFENELTGWVVASPGTVDPGNLLKTTDGGKTWTSFHHKYQYSSMYWPSATVGYAGTWEGLIVKTTDGGKTWSDVSVPSTSNLHKLFFVNETYGFAVDTDHKLYRTSNGGTSWDVFAHNGISAVYFHDKLNGFCVNEYGQVGHSKDGGVTFTYWNSPYPEYKLHDIAFSDARNGIAIGGLNCAHGTCTPKPAIFITRDGGLTWANDTKHPHLGQDIGFYAIDFSPSGAAFIAGSDHIMLRNAKFTGISTTSKESDLSFYPNPASSSFQVVAGNSSAIGQEFILTNCLGQVLKTWKMEQSTATIDVNDLAPGMYIVVDKSRGLSYKLLKD